MYDKVKGDGQPTPKDGAAEVDEFCELQTDFLLIFPRLAGAKAYVEGHQ